MAPLDTLSPPEMEPLPGSFVSTRRSLHQLAFFAMSPARYQATGRMGLRPFPGGFGTPPWDTPAGQRRVRLEGDRLVLETGDTVETTVPATLRAAVDLLGIDYVEDWFDFGDPLVPIGLDSPLVIDAKASAAHARWFDFTRAVLERFSITPGAVDVSEIQLWPEHFDVALEMGSESAGYRASYGGSPGDDAHAEPYLYVAAWGGIDRSEPFWNDLAFNGASLAHAELLAAADPVALSLEFFRRGLEILTV